MKLIPIEQVTLIYYCDSCQHIAEQPLPDITSVGTLVCPDCDTDMVLDKVAKLTGFIHEEDGNYVINLEDKNDNN